MAQGLINQAKQSQQVPAQAHPRPAQSGQPAPDDDFRIPGAEDATPEEQQAYESGLAAVSKILHEDDKSSESVLNMLRQGKPQSGVVTATAMILAEVDRQLDVPETVILELVADILDQVIELGSAAGIFEMSDQEIKQAYLVAVKEILAAYGMEEGDVEELMSGMDESTVNTLADTVMEAG